MPKAYITLFFSYREQLALLNDEERGRLILHLLEYAENGTIPALDGMLKMAFAFIKSQIDRDLGQYEKRCEKNRENANKRWSEGGNDKSECDRMRTDAKHAKKKKNKMNSIPPTPTGEEADQMQESMELPGESLMGETAGGADEESVYHFTTPTELFDRFWSAYPRKVSKPNASKAFNKLNVTEPLLADMLAALDWQRTLEDWTKEGGKFIPHPASWLNGRRWEDEPPPRYRPIQNASPVEPAPRYETTFENGRRVAKLVT